jgi:AraC-like DNA-binding protein
MKLHLLDRTSLKNSSFTVKDNCYPYFLKIWHYHPELELVAVLKSTGTRFIGDSIEKFEEGEVVLIGENLPHMWQNDDAYFDDSSDLTAQAIAVHFKKELFGTEFFNAPEMKHIAELFETASHGIKFLGISTKIIDEIKSMLTLDRFEKTMKFIRILDVLSKHKNYKLLSSKGFIKSFNRSKTNNLDKTYEYVFNNFNNPISLNDVAAVACMNPSAFSRFFKRINRKTFTRYLNEIRIGYACKLLLEHKVNITTICYEAGFNNISNFNRQFKKIKGISPTDYLRRHPQ